MTGKLVKTIVFGLLAGIPAVYAAQHAKAAVSYDTRALSGTQAPGTGPGILFNSFTRPNMNSAGQVVFEAVLEGPRVDNTTDIGIWSDGSGSLELVARTGSAASGTDPGVVYKGLGSSIINDTGQTVFYGVVKGSGVTLSNDIGIWREHAGASTLVVRKGDEALENEPGVVFSNFHNPAFNASGQVAIRATISGAGTNFGNDSGIWVEQEDGLSLVIREGDQVQGAPVGAYFGSFDLPVLSSSGDVAFRFELVGLGFQGEGIWSEGGDSPHLVALTGVAAPDTEEGVVFSDFSVTINPGGSNPAINGSGQTSFVGIIEGPGVNYTNNSGIWLENDASINLVVREGDDAPGLGTGVLFDDFRNLNNPVLNGAGKVAFHASLKGPTVDSTNMSSIWAGDSDALTMIARAGDAAPGSDDDAYFSSFFTPSINGDGQVAFLAILSGLGVTSANDIGIWATDSSGAITLIAREGDLFNVSNDPYIDDFRVISFIDTTIGSGGEDGRQTNFNDADQVAFHLKFDDGSEGIFVATIFPDGDLNRDGFVGIEDLNTVLSNWNQNVTPGNNLLGDPSGDGFVGIEDLNMVLGNWNDGTPPTIDFSAIPEPSTMILLLIGGTLCHRRLYAA